MLSLMITHRLWPVLAVLVTAGLVCGSLSLVSHAETTPAPPVHGMWVANVASPTLASPANIRDFVDLASRVGVNTLYVVVWNRGLTTYPSEIMHREFGVRCDPRYAEFDPLEEMITAAHARQIRVLAWFEFGFASSYGEADGGHILRRHPEWAARDRSGKLASRNGFQWMNSFHPEVQAFVLALLKELLENYELDGIQGDDRLPACPSSAGYDPWTVALYKQQHGGQSPPEDELRPAWIDWRAQLLNQFMHRMHRELKEVQPEAVLSAAPSVYPWSKEHYLQDWPTWLAQGWVDEVCPQVYRENLKSYQNELQKLTTSQIAPHDMGRVFPGILVQTAAGLHNDGRQLDRMVRANRTAGFAGEVIFYDAALRDHPEWFQTIWVPRE